ncbi:AAA family ATPase [Salinivibrio kushneri]|uniref:AAA family ATPase n=1 Tax=Salinivibrio kushneri TaxID=1908198 RepID=UPI0009884389|nr:AAA family ATPase [Salinivibrio kushneri]OOE53514.1 hypothetical protein BZG12_08750 [Salinivibrio kushneri]
MISFYLDNYRGFSKEYIELKSVNFLVGENSTGKTSFLSIVKLMASPSFWLDTDFNDQNIRLGSFSELINKGGVNKKNFSIGYYTFEEVESPEEEENAEADFKLVTFKNEEGLPVVSKHSFLLDGSLITTIIRKDAMLYKRHDLDLTQKNPKEIFESCYKEHQSTSIKNYKKISADGFPRKLFFAHADRLVSAALDGDDFLEGRKSFSLYLRSSLPRICWIAPIRAKPESTYEGFKTSATADGEHIPQLLNKMISKSKNSGKNSKIVDAINKFGSDSGLFDKVDTKRFGKELSSPFEMHVVLNGKTIKVCNVGYGVSQVLPIVTEVLARTGEPTFSIQQPEVHLHPKAQASLGEFIYHAANENGSKFIIETHSDYMIDRFRLSKNKNQEDQTSCQILFFERGGEANKVHAIEINEDGSYPLEQPEAFRDFFVNEELELLRL